MVLYSIHLIIIDKTKDTLVLTSTAKYLSMHFQTKRKTLMANAKKKRNGENCNEITIILQDEQKKSFLNYH